MTRKLVPLLFGFILIAAAAFQGTAAAESPPSPLHFQACLRIWDFGKATYGEWLLEDQAAAAGDAEAAARAEELEEDLDIAEHRWDRGDCTEVTGYTWYW